MQAYQRKRHRVLWVLIAVVIAIAIAIALTGKKSIPAADQLPDQASTLPGSLSFLNTET